MFLHMSKSQKIPPEVLKAKKPVMQTEAPKEERTKAAKQQPEVKATLRAAESQHPYGVERNMAANTTGNSRQPARRPANIVAAAASASVTSSAIVYSNNWPGPATAPLQNTKKVSRTQMERNSPMPQKSKLGPRSLPVATDQQHNSTTSATARATKGIPDTFAPLPGDTPVLRQLGSTVVVPMTIVTTQQYQTSPPSQRSRVRKNPKKRNLMSKKRKGTKKRKRKRAMKKG
ncbi:hypothetical protein B0T17DRAFT_218985 [Bombardia bombarda]|uniref:Uncharacterized protein n=1 Tax=Bombardia bombarda TaxID=252184 RepID=A0AA40CAK2_9PEZI|nr:hypothetical protein B0T17DRAFT_218985 [Bombardia bombarda]